MRSITSEKERVMCSRCDKVANPSDGWEHGWPLYGKIHVGFPGQLFAFLGGAEHIADTEHFEWWKEGHPAIKEGGSQETIFEWGNGYRYDSKGRYRLCYDCQKQFLYMLGDFFGIKQRVDEIRLCLREKGVKSFSERLSTLTEN